MLGRFHKLTPTGYTLIEIIVLVGIIGAMTVIAGPACSRYMRRAKTTEAIDELDKIYKGAAYYYTAPFIDPEGRKILCQFPADQGKTPADSCCAKFGGPDADRDGRCDSNALAWNTRTWSALSYQMLDQAYFVYSWDQNDAVMSNAQATASANADIDCDGIQSTFQRLIHGAPDANENECNSVGASAMFVNHNEE